MSKKIDKETGLIKQGYLDFSKTLDRNKKEFQINYIDEPLSKEQEKAVNEAMQKLENERNKKDTIVIDEPELHLHLNSEIKTYLQQIIQKQVEESLIKMKKELDSTKTQLNNITDVVKDIMEVSGWYENNSNSGINDVLNSGLFAGAGGLNFNNKDSQADLIAKDSKGNLYLLQGISNNNKSKIKGVSTPKGDYDISKLDIVEHSFEKYIKDNGINQTLLSTRTGISRSSLINIMKNPSNVSLLNARKIAIALNEDMEVLFPSLHSPIEEFKW
jgi:DNA-binding XRE family transcriptional regulator